MTNPAAKQALDWKEGAVGFTEKLLDEVRAQIAPEDPVMAEARKRRDLLKKLGKGFPGALDTFNSGSLAHGFANKPLSDADGGLKLSRVTYRRFDPDGGGESPEGLVDDLCTFLGPLVRETYPKAQMRQSKRGVKAHFFEPILGVDPSVDLIPALSRADGGLWIPNTEKGRFDASNPELHTALFTSGTDALRRKRARAVRLMKAWNNLFSQPGLCSFNISVLGWESVTGGLSGAETLLGLFEDSAAALSRGLTKDPARLSGSIKLCLARDQVVDRLRKAQAHMRTALASDDDEDKVRDALSKVFKELVEPAPGDSSSAWASALRGGNGAVSVGATGVALGAAGKPLKTTSSFGDDEHLR